MKRFVWGVLFATAGTVGVSAAESGDDKVTVLASETISKGSFESDRVAARDSALAAAEAQGSSAELWRRAGDLSFQLGQVGLAHHAWIKAAALRPHDLMLVQRIAVGAFGIGDFASAAQHHARLARSFSAPSKRALRLGHLMASAEAAALAGDFTTGEISAKHAIRESVRRDDQIQSRLALAYVHLLGLEYNEAEGLYQDVLAVSPENIVALNNMGNIHCLRRDFDEAAKHFVAILEQENVATEAASIASANLGEISALRGHHGDARWLYEQGRTLHPAGAWSYFGLAVMADIEGDYSTAMNYAIDGWERDPSQLTRLNTVYVQPEWQWHQDALIAELEGHVGRAEKLWSSVASGDVPALRDAAQYHLVDIADSSALASPPKQQ